MTQVQSEDLEEKPLDPEMEKVRRKMVRLLAVSIGVMFIGLMAVLGAIVYKFTTADDENTRATQASSAVPSDAPLSAKAKLPAGYRVLSASLDEDRLVLLGQNSGGEQQVFVMNLATGRMIAEIEIGR